VHRWPGYNFAIDPAGDIFAETNLETHEPCMLVADLDPQQLAAQRAPIDVKTHKGIIRGDYVAVRRRDTFGQLLEPDGRPN